jgi:hypothetical protein
MVAAIYQIKGWGRNGPKPCSEPLMRVHIKPGASFTQLDAYLRELMNKDGHLSTFSVKTGKKLYGRPEEVTIEGDYGDFGPSDFMKKGATKVKTLLWAGNDKASEAVWNFDIGNPTHAIIRALELASEEQTSRLICPIEDACSSESERDEDVDEDECDTTGPSFDEAYPALFRQLVSMDGIMKIGNGAFKDYGFAGVWNEGGPVADLDSPPADESLSGTIPGDVLSKSFRQLDREATRTYGGIMSPHTFMFSFPQRYPKVAGFISTSTTAGTSKRWLEIGTGRGGPFIKAMKGPKQTVVWQSPVREQYGRSVHAALCALEKHL